MRLEGKIQIVVSLCSLHHAPRTEEKDDKWDGVCFLSDGAVKSEKVLQALKTLNETDQLKKIKLKSEETQENGQQAAESRRKRSADDVSQIVVRDFSRKACTFDLVKQW